MEGVFDFNRVYFGNTVLDYIYVVGGILVAWLILQIIKKWILNWVRNFASRSKTNFDDVIISAFEKFVIPYLYWAINFAIIDQLKLSAKANVVLHFLFTLITVYYVVRMINHALHFSVRLYMRRRNEAEARIFQLNGILNVIKVIIWALGLLFLLDNLGYDVTALVAGLGIGGIAIALAAQNILSDLFSYFVIFFDKPFEIGDFVVAGDKSGVVEQIGIKTSRIRTLGGEELVMPNAELVKTPIHNYKRQEKRRVLFNIRVVYSTSADVLRQIPEMLSGIISTKENVLFDRAHLQNLADYFINFEVVYNIQTADYAFFMNTHQQICLEVIEAFRNKGIEFAIPSQKLFVSNNGDEGKDESAKSEILIS